MRKKVLVNIEFRDAYNLKKVYQAGSFEEFSEDRVKEILAIDKNLITVVGNVEEPEPNISSAKPKTKKAEKILNPTEAMLNDLNPNQSKEEDPDGKPLDGVIESI